MSPLGGLEFLNWQTPSVLLFRTIVVISFLGILACDRKNVVDEIDFRELDPQVAERIGEYQRRESEYPDDPVTVGELGIVYHVYGFYGRASHCYVRAANLDPKEPRWLYYHAHVLALNAQFDAALDKLADVIRLEPDYILPHIFTKEIGCFFLMNLKRRRSHSKERQVHYGTYPRRLELPVHT